MKAVAACVNKRRMIVGVSVITLVCLLSNASAREDWQYWSTWTAAHKLSEKASVSAMAEIYFRDDMKDDYVYDEYITYTRKIGYGFGLIAQGYFESVQSAAGEWNGTRSAVAGATYSFNVPCIADIKLEDRFFYKVNSPAQWDYHRPRLYISRAFGPVTLMLSDEMRVDLSGSRDHNFYRNRIYATVILQATDCLALGLGCLRQSDRDANGDWSSVNGMQTVLSFVF